MRVIWKYSIDPVPGEQVISMPVNSNIFQAGIDAEGKPSIWAEVNDDQPVMEDRKVIVVWTGQPIVMGAVHRGSFILGRLVFHVYIY